MEHVRAATQKMVDLVHCFLWCHGQSSYVKLPKIPSYLAMQSAAGIDGPTRSNRVPVHVALQAKANLATNSWKCDQK